MKLSYVGETNKRTINTSKTMKIRSTAFPPYGEIPEKYTYLGENVNPPLVIDDVPDWAQSLILLVEDLDTPNNFINWIVYNIDPKIVMIQEDTIPGKQSRNSSRELNYVGCTPLEEDHQIRFTVIATSKPIKIPDFATRRQIFDLIKNVRYQKAEMIGIVKTKASHWAIE